MGIIFHQHKMVGIEPFIIHIKLNLLIFLTLKFRSRSLQLLSISMFFKWMDLFSFFFLYFKENYWHPYEITLSNIGVSVELSFCWKNSKGMYYLWLMKVKEIEVHSSCLSHISLEKRKNFSSCKWFFVPFPFFPTLIPYLRKVIHTEIHRFWNK